MSQYIHFIRFLLFFVRLLPPVNSKESVSLLFVGDVLLDGAIRYYANLGISTYNATFANVAPVIREADLAIANLESAVGTDAMRNNPVKEITRSPFLLGSPEAIESLKFAGFDAVTLANNHANDFGDTTIKLTRKMLDKYGIGYFGINYGRKPYASQIPLIKDVKGIRLGFLGYEMIKYVDTVNASDEVTRKKFREGMALFKKSTAKKDIAFLKKNQVDVIVVYMHWGASHTKGPIKSQKTVASFLRNAGVQIVVGCHTHSLQGHSFHKHFLVAYGLGNFVFGPMVKNFWKFFSRSNPYTTYFPTAEHIKAFEHAAKSAQDPTRILRIEVNKYGPISASYLPCNVSFNIKRKQVQIVCPDKQEWVDVCGGADKHCIHV